MIYLHCKKCIHFNLEIDNYVIFYEKSNVIYERNNMNNNKYYFNETLFDFINFIKSYCRRDGKLIL
jgi:hypothetical protein